MVKKDLFKWFELADVSLRRRMKLGQADLEEEALDDLNGLTPWEDAFMRGTRLANSDD